MASIEEKIENLIINKVNELGFELYDVEYIKEGKEYYLRVYIDKQDGIDLNDCETVSNEISNILGEANYIKEQYFLEVSSPGIERILRKDKHLGANIGNKIEIKLYKPIEKQRQYIGTLLSFSKDTIEIEDLSIDRKNIAQIKTVYDWE